MVAPVWPSNVPYEQARDGAAIPVPHRAPLVSETEGGPDLMRPRPGPRATEVSWRSVPWTEDQLASFLAFAQADLRDGSLHFDMPVFKPGQGYVARRCQIKKGAAAIDESAAPLFVVSFTLIVFNW